MARWLPRVRNGVPDTPSNPRRLTADPCNKVVVVGTIAMTCGVMLLALVTRQWHVYVAFAVMSVGWATMSGAAINIIVAPWFDSRRGVAVSWAMNGASAGGMI